jgi:hypothetical protein
MMQHNTLRALGQAPLTELRHQAQRDSECLMTLR